MKINDLTTVRTVAAQRAELTDMLNKAQAGAIVMKIGGSTGRDIETALRPALITELTKQRDALDKQLADLGVTIEPEAAPEPEAAAPTKTTPKKDRSGLDETGPGSKV